METSSKSDLNELRRRVIHAGTWVMGGHFASQVVRLAGNLLLTRMLAPEMFGVVGIATVFIVGLHLFSDLGINQVIVQSKHGEDPDFLNTAWTVQIIRGFAIALIGLVLSGAIALAAAKGWVPPGSTYANPALPWVLGVLSCTAIINGFATTKIPTSNRNLSAGRITLINLISQVIGLVCMLAWAWWQPSIAALVAGAVVSAFAVNVLSHIWLPGTNNRLCWNALMAKEIFGFGKWIFLTSILGFLTANEDRIVLGWLISAEQMGLYAIAALLAGALSDVVGKLLASVVYPALGEIAREHGDKSKELYYRIRRPIDMLCLSAMGFLFISGNALVHLLYDSRYAGAGRMLEILALPLFSVRYSVVGQLCLVLGKPYILSLQQTIKVIALSSFILIGFFWNGLTGAVWGIGLSSMPGMLVLIVIKKRLGILDVKKELQAGVWLLLGLAIGSLGVAVEALR